MPKLIDMTGQRYGMLLVLGRVPRSNGPKSTRTLWLVRCDCGTEKTAGSNDIRHGKTRSCGCKSGNALDDLTGQRFGRRVVVERATNGPRQEVMWLVRCDCGNTRAVYAQTLRRGTADGCGKRDCCVNTRHGHTAGGQHTVEYNAWQSMMARCYNSQNESYHYYGDRGITVCKRWHTVKNFLADMGQRPSARHSLDRIDNEGNYEPNNCRWATIERQNRNRRSTIMVTTANGERVPLCDLADLAGVSHNLAGDRIRHGWSVERTLATVSGRVKLTAGDVVAIRQRHARGEKPADLAREFAVTPSNVLSIVHRKTWRHVA